MKTMRYHRKMLMLGLALATALVCMTACASSTAKTVKVGNDTVPTLYAAVGERKITGTASSVENGESSKKLTYAAGTVSKQDSAAYLEHMLNNGFVLLGEDTNEWQVAKPASSQYDKVLVVIMKTEPGSSAEIRYDITSGTLEGY